MSLLFPAARRLIGAILLVTALDACAPASSSLSSPEAIAEAAGMQRQEVPAEFFRLLTYSRLTDINAPITIYIEGEKPSYLYTPAVALPPDNLMGLRLAALDPSPNVAYIARPCQFTSGDQACDGSFLKNGRYAEIVLTSMNRAVDHFAVPFTVPRLNLVGYSNGGAVAAILAVRRKDVVSLRTVAGNMDPYGSARFMGYDGADDLIDPMPIAYRLRLLPQEHMVGSADTLTPPFLTANFIKAIGRSFCVTMVQIPGATHEAGWEADWAVRAASPPICDGARLVQP